MASIALGIAGLLSAGTSIASGVMGSNAADDAAATQAKGAQDTIPITNNAVNTAKGDLFNAQNSSIGWQEALMQYANSKLAPYSAAGGTGLDRIGNTLDDPALNTPFNFSPTNGVKAPGQFSFNPTDLQNDPGYKFNLQQGLNAIDAGAASKGMAASGGTIKAEQTFGSGLAENTFNNAFQRAMAGYNTNANTYNSQFGQALSTFSTNRDTQLSKLAQEFNLANLGFASSNQMGQNAINQGVWAGNTAMNAADIAGNWGLQGAGQINNAITGAANANAAGSVGSANAWSNALGGLGNSGSNLANMYMLSQMFGPKSTGGGGTPNIPYVSPDASYQFGG